MASIIFATPTNTFNSFHFSSAGQQNQEACAIVSLPGPGRVTDLNTFWDGDGATTQGANVMWNNGGAIELSSAGYTSNVGGESLGGQSLHTTIHDYFYSTTHNVNVGFWRDRAKSSVASVATGGVDGIAKVTTNPGAIDTMTSASSFLSVYGAGGKGSIRAYGHYTPSAILVWRGSWVPVNGAVGRPVFGINPSTFQGNVHTLVRRGTVWTPLNLIPSDEWDDAREQRAIVLIDDNWEYGIIRDEEPVLFGVAA